MKKMKLNCSVYPYLGALIATFIVLFIVYSRWVGMPILPVDETRYLSVSWEMLQEPSWLVPMLNDLPYAHKPPLLFWLINAMWKLFGVSDLSALMVIPTAAVISIWLITLIAREFEPTKPQFSYWTPLILATMCLWMFYQPMIMFDILVATYLLLACYAMLRYQRSPSKRWLALAAFSIGFGFLAKGPVLMVYWLPIVLAYPYWKPRCDMVATNKIFIDDESVDDNAEVQKNQNSTINDTRINNKKWYKACAIATVIGIAIILVWAIPAAIVGGAEYTRAIFWDQSAGRMAASFAHARPWYWYLMMLPLFLLPWPLIWGWEKPQIRNIKSWGKQLTAMHRFAIVGFLPALFIFSLFSGKQPHYILPTLPFVALWIATKLDVVKAKRQWGYLIFLIVISIVFLIAPNIAAKPFPLTPLSNWVRLLALLPITCAVFFYYRPNMTLLLISFPVVLFSLVLCLKPAFNSYYDLTPTAQFIAKEQNTGRAIANVGKYHNQFRYLGRNDKPLLLIDGGDIVSWFDQYPDGLIILALRHPSKALLDDADFKQLYRSRYLLLLDKKAWLSHVQELSPKQPAMDDSVE